MRKQEANKAENHEQQPMRLTRRIGQTTYKVNVHFSETSKETTQRNDRRTSKARA